MSCGQKGSIRTLFIGLSAAVLFTILYVEFNKWIYEYKLPRETAELSWTSTQQAVASTWTSTQEGVVSTWSSTKETVYSSWTSTSTVSGSDRIVYKQRPFADLTKTTLSWTEAKKTESPNRQTNDSQRPPILILLWRPLYKEVKNVEAQMAKHCPKHNCRLTSDRKYMPEADAVVIEVEGLYKLPRKTKMGQVWVYVEMESPAWRGNGMKTWKNLFNWTMTYRRDSDIPHFYGSLTTRNQEVNRTLRQEMFTSKNKSMLWLVSNCNTPGKREIFVKQLQKFTPVDVVGRCGKHVCPKGNNCEGSLLKNYKFYFAAENSNCRDYITEKAYRPFGHNILPVVRGGGNYSMYFPPKSYINTDKFKSKKLLGSYRYLRNHLNFVDVHEKIFESYISVIEQYNADIILNQMWVPFCTLCDRLNNQSKFRRLYRSIHDWWRGQERTSGYFCKKDELARL